ncbi:MAG TPA: magnesium/cobalt transporter CorA [Nocardioidaceae bacterium]|nr:magnesium/cobalt transporter CorA [Nocardioidaceae bacterium]
MGGVIVDCAVYRDGTRLDLDCRDDMPAAVKAADEPRDFVWVGLHEPSAAELDRVAKIFDLHPLAVEDAVHAHQRPKLEHYADGLFLVLKTLWYVEATDEVETGEIAVFVGEQYVVTVRHGAGAALASARRDLEQRAAVLGHGSSSVVYAVCDRVVDEYQEVAEALEIDVDEIERSVFSTERTSDDAERIYLLKREVQEFRRAAGPLREPMSRFANGAVTGVPADSAPFFRDVLDHVIRVSEQVAALDDLLGNALTAHLARLSLQQNDDMRKISAWVAIAALPTMVAGIYGMNFEHMPELEWRFGYPVVVGVMAIACAALYRFFKRAGWL